MKKIKCRVWTCGWIECAVSRSEEEKIHSSGQANGFARYLGASKEEP